MAFPLFQFGSVSVEADFDRASFSSNRCFVALTFRQRLSYETPLVRSLITFVSLDRQVVQSLFAGIVLSMPV